MSKSDNQLFIDFIKSFDDGMYRNHKFQDTITEISRRESGDRTPLVENKKVMYSLDDIAKGSKILRDNLPKTTDALYYKEDGDKLSLILIEFKFHNLDDPDAGDLLDALVDNFFAEEKKYKCLDYDDKKDLNKIRNYYGDGVTNALVLKPLESLKVVIPKLYEEYCSNNSDNEELDINNYLDNIEKRYFVFVSTYTENGKFNRHKEELESQSTGLEKYLDRLKFGKIIDHYEIWPSCDFKDFLECERLVELMNEEMN